MSPAELKHESAPPRRRYLVHLLCVFDGGCESCRYIVRIRPWTGHSGGVPDESRERAFADEYELIATINPLLPRGSDVRDIFGLIESPSGFFYLLYLSGEEAGRLGWRRELSSGG